jgi:hypothetical protein
MLLIAPRNPFYRSFRGALWDAQRIAHNTGARQRVEITSLFGTTRFRIVPAKPPAVVA